MSTRRAKVLYDFEAQNEEELNVRGGEILDVIQEHDDGWAHCQSVTSPLKKGLVPIAYLEIEGAATSQQQEQDGTNQQFKLLRVHVVEARNLVIRDLVSSDPYFVLQVGKDRKKTKIVYKSLNPKFDEVFYFEIRDVETGVIKLSLFDYDIFTAHDPMGEVILPLSALLGKGKVDKWFPLQNVSRGEVRLIFFSQ